MDAPTPQAHTRSISIEQQPLRWHPLDLAALLVLMAIAVGFAAWTFATYYQDPGDLWRGAGHDRNGHLLAAIDLAAAMRALDPVAFVVQLDKLRFYPPLFALLLAPVLLIGGFDIRLAVLPALFGWAAAIVLTGLIARRLFADRLPGYAAGGVAATFALASPGFRALGSDVMLEAPGAALTALVLLLYVQWRSAPQDPGRMRNLALALTALFFLKGNYWLLTAAALLLAYAIETRAEWLPFLRPYARAVRIPVLAAKAIRDPLFLGAGVLLVIVVAIYLNGPTSITLWGRRVSLYPPGNLLTVAWLLLFIRCALTWRRHRSEFERLLPKPALILFYFHAVPLAVWFLLPRRLSSLMTMVSPTNAAVGQGIDPWKGLQYYGHVFVDSFHVAPWSAWLACGLALVAVLRLHRLAPGAIAVAILFALSACATIIHPNTQGRYMASWIFSFWVMAGAGAGILLGLLVSHLAETARRLVATAAIGLLVLMQLTTTPSPTAKVHASHFTDMPRDFDLIAAYRDRLADVPTAGILATMGTTPTLVWPLRSQCRCLAKVDVARLPPPDPTRAGVREFVLDWLRFTPADRIAMVDTEDLSLLPGWSKDSIAGIRDAMHSQDRFKLIESIDVSSYPAKITIWQRR